MISMRLEAEVRGFEKRESSRKLDGFRTGEEVPERVVVVDKGVEGATSTIFSA